MNRHVVVSAQDALVSVFEGAASDCDQLSVARLARQIGVLHVTGRTARAVHRRANEFPELWPNAATLALAGTGHQSVSHVFAEQPKRCS